MIQVPPLVSAKLHYRYSNAVGAAFSAPVLLCHPGTPPFWFCVVCPVWLVFCSCCVFSRCVGFDVPSDVCGTLPCLHLGAGRLELRLDCESLSICFVCFVADLGFWFERH